MNNCPKCGSPAAPERSYELSARGKVFVTFTCGAYTENGKYMKDAWGRCRIRELEAQLADAKLLAKAANRKRVWWDENDGEVHVFDEHVEFAMFVDSSPVVDGLPILTDELREHLRKAIQ